MKIRIGFVSNSSSCSFIVDDAKSAIMEFKREFGKKYDYKNMPYSIEDINLFLRGKKKPLEKIKEFLECDNNIERSYDDSYTLYGLTLYGIMSIPTKLLKHIDSLGIEADNLNDGNVMIVRLLREFFKQHSFNTKDAGDTWSGLDGDDFMSKLLCKVIVKMEI